MTARRRTLAGLLAIAVAITAASCVKPTTFNPYAAPDKGELDRLQKIINDRPDLEVTQGQLLDLDGRIRAVIARYSPTTYLGPSTPLPSQTCIDPFTHNIGQSFGIGTIYAAPAPSSGDWSEISADLDPMLTAAGFRPNRPPDVPPPTGDGSYIRDDGSTIELGYSPGVLSYAYSTGCHLPAAWRTAPPPPDGRPINDAGVHYPYLYSSPGGRTADAK